MINTVWRDNILLVFMNKFNDKTRKTQKPETFLGCQVCQ